MPGDVAPDEYCGAGGGSGSSSLNGFSHDCLWRRPKCEAQRESERPRTSRLCLLSSMATFIDVPYPDEVLIIPQQILGSTDAYFYVERRSNY